MKKQDAVQLLTDVEEWNKYRHSNPTWMPDLSVVYLAGANLVGANLRGANLRSADLVGADLVGADLALANLRGAYLAGADLALADLAGANLVGANLRGANLRSADIAGANLTLADLALANLVGADLRGANLRSADFAGADLAGADLDKAKLRRSQVYVWVGEPDWQDTKTAITARHNMTKHTYEISAVAGDDETTITLELDQDQASLLRTIEHMMHKTKPYYGRPSILIDKISN